MSTEQEPATSPQLPAEVRESMRTNPKRPLGDGEGATTSECYFWDKGFEAGFLASRSAPQPSADVEKLAEEICEEIEGDLSYNKNVVESVSTHLHRLVAAKDAEIEALKGAIEQRERVCKERFDWNRALRAERDALNAELAATKTSALQCVRMLEQTEQHVAMLREALTNLLDLWECNRAHWAPGFERGEAASKQAKQALAATAPKNHSGS